MRSLSRRQVLSLVPAAGLLTVASPIRAFASTPATASADHDQLIANTTAIFAGTEDSNARPEVADKLEAIAATARSRLAAMDAAAADELFDGEPLGDDDVNLRQSFQFLYEIALATRTPNGAPDLVGNTAAQRRVLDGLIWLHDNFYGDQDSGYYGNWHNWEIGSSTHISKTLVLLADLVAAEYLELPATYVASMDAYLRNGKNGDVDLDSRFHTGANLADITTNRILQGAVLGDDARIAKAIGDQSTVFATIDPYNLQHGNTDGHYADGSFIQHHSVAYTGSYGKILLTRVVQTMKILAGTSHADGGDLAGVVTGWVTDGFAPLIFEGWMMEIVKGRAVSRTTTGYADVGVIVEAVVDLSGHAAGTSADALKGYVKFIDSTSPTAVDPGGFVSPVSIAQYAAVVNDDTVTPADLNPPARSVAFNAMDKAVHRRPGYAFALARSSDRISKYEYMLGENLMPWFQADGAHYLYLAGQDQRDAFGVDFYTTVSPYRLPGVTAPVEQRRSVPELYGELWYENPDHPLNFTSSSESQNKYVYFPRGTNAYSGGATLGGYGAAGVVQSDDVPYVDMQAGILPDDFVVYQNAASTKSWFMFDDEIVALAAGIAGKSGRDVVTTLDSRIAGTSDPVTVTGELRDGSPWSGAGSAPLAWLRWSDGTVAVGYVLLDDQDVAVAVDEVTNSRRIVRTRNPDTMVTKQVFNASIAHPSSSGKASLAYAIVPNASETAMGDYADGRLHVLANNTRVQAVEHTALGIVAANVFDDRWHRTTNLAVQGPASVMVQRAGGTVRVALSDPTMSRDEAQVTIRGRRLRVESADDGVTARRVTGGMQLTIATHQAYGRSFTATLTTY